MATGVVLVAIVVVATVLDDPSSSMIEDEAVVLAAISAVAPAEENCILSSGYNTDDLWGWDPDGRVYGVTWGLPHPHGFIRTAVIECIVQDDINRVWFELKIRYPLKKGKHSAEINEQVRMDVAGMVTDYYDVARTRISALGEVPYEDMSARSGLRQGSLNVTGFVSFMNDGLYSVALDSGAHDPGANTSDNYLRTLNFDLETGDQFFLADLLKPGVESREALLSLAVANHDYYLLETDDLNRRRGPGDRRVVLRTGHVYHPRAFVLDHVPVAPAALAGQLFPLTADALVLHCTVYCDSGIARKIMFKNDSLEIPHDYFSQHMDPEGPARHLAQVQSGGQG